MIASFRILSQALHLELGEIHLEISTAAQWGKGALTQVDGGCGHSDLARRVTLPLQMPGMHHGQRFRGFKMSLSLYSAKYSSMLWGPESSHSLPPSHALTATTKALCKLLLQSHEEKEKHLK